jgi:hypothetical protein
MKGKSKDFLNAKSQDLSTQQATLKTSVTTSSKVFRHRVLFPYVQQV